MASFQETLVGREAGLEYRRQQVVVEPRHPMVWLNYAYDAKASGNVQETANAFNRALAFSQFLSDENYSMLPRFATELGVQYVELPSNRNP
jgi:hypothetical protein